MGFIKRIFLFLMMNFLVVIMVSLILNFLNVKPYLASHGLDYRSLMIFCLVWGMAGALISLAMSRKMAKWMLGVRVIDPNTHDIAHRELIETVRKLCTQADIPLPEIGIFQSEEVNAFATGPTKRKSLIAVSSGLLDRMNKSEIEGVLGHEIAHIANGDMVTMTLLQGVVNAFVMFLARVLAFALSGMGKNNQKNHSFASYYLFVFLFEVVFMILGSILIASYSRYREFRADRGGAKIAGREKMISALQSLRILHNIQDNRKEAPAFQAFKISQTKKKGLYSLFATHPPLEQRIERLQRNV